MIKLFSYIDKAFTSNGDKIIKPFRAKVHNEDNGDYIFGPKKCCWELFYSSAIKPTETPYIEEKTYVGKPGSNKRIISGDNKGVNEDYRYYVQEIDDKIVKNYKDSPWKNS